MRIYFLEEKLCAFCIFSLLANLRIQINTHYFIFAYQNITKAESLRINYNPILVAIKYVTVETEAASTAPQIKSTIVTITGQFFRVAKLVKS